MPKTINNIVRKKPWNRVSLPVYSISSKGEKNNMHICTYVSAVSMHPKRMMVSIFHGTQTISNVEMQPDFVLQLLAESQYRLVQLLGKQSGKSIDKIDKLHKRNQLTTWNGFHVLKDALAVMHLKVLSQMEAGDHNMYLCDVTEYKNLNDGPPLTTNFLSQKGIIRI
jgi:flavin reductase (DIM6/NTAB) family NADH-FMN oxidoreductase RutF